MGFGVDLRPPARLSNVHTRESGTIREFCFCLELCHLFHLKELGSIQHRSAEREYIAATKVTSGYPILISQKCS